MYMGVYVFYLQSMIASNQKLHGGGKSLGMIESRNGVHLEGRGRIVSEKEGLVNQLGWKCTLHQVCRCTFDWILISILVCIN